MPERMYMRLSSTKRQNRLTQLLIFQRIKSFMENEDNLPAQCHPIIKSKKKTRIKSEQP
jgi:hypothetical protein